MLLSLLKMAAPYLAGGGPTGMVARKAVDWVQERLEEPDEQRVTSARLVPGDRLEVVARPAPTKQERQLEARLAAARARLAHARSVKPKQVKVAARLAREADLLVRFDRMDRRRGDRRLAEAEVIELSERLEAVRAAALAAAGGSGTTRRVFYRADD